MPETLMMRRSGNKLVPCAAVDEEALEAFPEGKDLTVSVSRTRSQKHNRFFWALLQKICVNHETYSRPDQLMLWLKVRLGYVEEVRFHNDKVWWVAKSISFNAMGQDEFKKFFDASLDVIVAEVIPNLDTRHLIREVEEMVGFKLEDIWGKDNGLSKEAR